MKKIYIIASMLCICLFLSACNSFGKGEETTSLPSPETTTSAQDTQTSADETTTEQKLTRFDPYKYDPYRGLHLKEIADSVGYDYSTVAPLLPLDAYSEYLGKTLTYKECLELFGMPFDNPVTSIIESRYFTSDGYMIIADHENGGFKFHDTALAVEEYFPEEKYPYYYKD